MCFWQLDELKDARTINSARKISHAPSHKPKRNFACISSSSQTKVLDVPTWASFHSMHSQMQWDPEQQLSSCRNDVKVKRVQCE